MYDTNQDLAWSIFKLFGPYADMEKVKDHLKNDFGSSGVDLYYLLKVAKTIETYWKDMNEYGDMSLEQVLSELKELENIPIDEEEQIEKEFKQFEIGTLREAIWLYYEDVCEEFSMGKYFEGYYESIQ